MNRILLMIAAILLSQSVFAKEVRTELFVVDVPSDWQVEDNKLSIILATGAAVTGSGVKPLLSMQYCSSSRERVPNLLACNEPCSSQSLSFLLENKSSGLVFSPVSEEVAESGGTVYRTQASVQGKGAVVAVLMCGGKGHVYLSLTSDELSSAATLMSTLQKSLRWY